jgi:sterol desaturase/sphingolipid hydroxylase (fatty acid hydroxylase superfamily)
MIKDKVDNVSFGDTLIGVIIAFVGVVLMLFAIGILTFPNLLAMYGFPQFGVMTIPIAIIFFIFGIALVIYGQRRAGIR